METKNLSTYSTLKDFSGVVDGCQVTDAKANEISLVDGLNEAVKQVEAVGKDGKKVVLIGNGGSAAIASHQATDLWKNGGIRGIAFNDISLLTCAANDFGYEYVFEKPILRFCDPGDLLIAISSSGKSANILNGVKAAREIGCGVVGFSGFGDGNPLRTQGDLNFYLASHSYGIVEVGHLLLIHAIIDAVIERQKGTGS